MVDLYDSDNSVDSDNEDNNTSSDNLNDLGEETGEADKETGEADKETGEGGDETGEGGDETGEGGDETGDEGEETGDEGEESGEEGSETSEVDENPPVDISEVIVDEDNFTELYKETNLNLFVRQLKESTLMDDEVRIMLGCKCKYVEIDVSRDIFGWSKQIKYPTEQYKTFVPAIPIQFVNMLANTATQRVSDMETMYDGLKNSTLPIDAISFLGQRKADQTIDSSSKETTVNNFDFGAFTPMVDLVLQNPGYLVVVGDPNSKLKGAFNFLNTSITKASKKEKRIQGKKEKIKSFNLRDIVFLLSAAGAKKIVFYNVSNSFTAEDDEVEELNEQDNLGEPDEVSLDTSTLEGAGEGEAGEGEEGEGEAGEGEEVVGEGEEVAGEGEEVAGEGEEVAGEGEEVAGEGEEVAGEGEEVAGEGESEVSGISGEQIQEDSEIPEEETASAEAVPEEAPVAPEEALVDVPEEAPTTPEVAPPAPPAPPAMGGSIFDDKMRGKYTHRKRKVVRGKTRKLGLVKKSHR